VQGDVLGLDKTSASNQTPAAASPDRSALTNAAPAERDAGEVLRSVYRDAVEEPVPDEMLDLLSKLD
jgi:hypothetical protein